MSDFNDMGNRPGFYVTIIVVLVIVCIICFLVNIYAIYTCRDFSKRLNEIDTQVNLSLLQNRQERAAFVDILSPDDGFDYTRTDCGTFLITLKDVSPHLNGGYKARITIGNMSNATFKGFKIKYNCGAIENIEAVDEISFTDTLYPGSWQDVTAYLSPPAKQGENMLWIFIDRCNNFKR